MSSERPDPGQYSAGEYEVFERRGVMAAMRDGVSLSVDIYSPTSSERLPAVLTMWPYDNNVFRARGRWFAERGFAFLIADSRGRFDSEGEWDPYDVRHKTDGYDLVEWIAAQPWSNGRVGMVGPSYAGWCQWWTASTAPPHLAAIVPEVAPPDAFENAPYQHGVLCGWVVDWAAMMAGRTNQFIGEAPYGGWAGRRREDFKQTPYRTINERRGLESAPWLGQWYLQNSAADPYWRGIAYQTEHHYSQMTVPSLAFTGWFDANHPGTPINYVGMKRFGATEQARHPAMIIGPWTHAGNGSVFAGVDFGPDATLDADGYIARWFDHFLKGIDNGVEREPPVHVFVMGENRWHAEQDWPLPQTTFTKYYLASGGSANSLKGDGVLTTGIPRHEGSDTYRYDPHYPTLDPSHTFADHNGHLDGPLDTRLSAIGDDVLVYQTPPLDAPIEVTGPIEATLYAATSAADTDWFVRLIEVHPDGRSLLLAEGALRARSSDPANDGRFNATKLTTIEPGTINRYTIRFWRGTANVFRPGHRIRVEISSSWYPYFLPNLNTGADNLATASLVDAVVAEQTIHHGPRYPSHVLLPVIRRELDTRQS